MPNGFCDKYFKIMEECVLNQIKGYWFLYDALNATITICMKLLVEFNHQAMRVLHIVYGTIDDELEILDGHMALEI
jgi:hypothetical protein